MFHNMRDVAIDSSALDQFKSISMKIAALKEALIAHDEG